MILGFEYFIRYKEGKVYKRFRYRHVCNTCWRFFWGPVNALYCKENCMPSKRARKRIEKRKGSNRIPKWQSKKELEEFYKQCPQDKVVDHVIPLNHPNVCGLHVISNLQYLSKEENSLKSNKWDGTLLNEGWRLLTCKSKI